MTTHIVSLTYRPKIEAVKSGACNQTIRVHNERKPKKAGDKLILHTWEGMPYRTKWDWRLETSIESVWLLKTPEPYVDLNGNPNLHANSYRISFDNGDSWEHIFDERLTELAAADHIENPSKETLEKTLSTLNNLSDLSGMIWDVIRWKKE